MMHAEVLCTYLPVSISIVSSVPPIVMFTLYDISADTAMGVNVSCLRMNRSAGLCRWAVRRPSILMDKTWPTFNVRTTSDSQILSRHMFEE